MSSKFTLSPATESDIPHLVPIYFSGWKDELWARFVLPDEPKYHSIACSLWLEEMRQNPHLKVMKCVHNDPDGAPQIVGFCFYYFLASWNTTSISASSTPKGKREGLPLSAPWFEDPSQRARAEAILASQAQQKAKLIAGRSCATMRRMSVRPDFQERGAGKMLLDWGCKQFDLQGCDAFLGATERGKRLYEKGGFEIIGFEEFEVEGEVTRYPCMWRSARKRYGEEGGS